MEEVSKAVRDPPHLYFFVSTHTYTHGLTTSHWAGQKKVGGGVTFSGARWCGGGGEGASM